MHKIYKWHNRLEQLEYGQISDRTNEVWDSDIAIVSPKILIDHRLLLACNNIQSQLPNKEFSIICKGAWTDRGFVVRDFFIPKQEIAEMSVDYLEELGRYKNDGYNTVIHSHPFQSNEFSYSDQDTINSNFDCSILYSYKEFKKAVLNIQINPKLKIQLEPALEIDFLSEDVIDISNIKEKPINYLRCNNILNYPKFNKIEYDEY